MLDVMGRYWWVIALRGVMAIIIGILIFLDPSVVLTLIAVFAIVDGVIGFIQALGQRGQTNWFWHLLESVAGIVIGILIIAFPLSSAVVITLLVASWAIITGVSEIMLAIRLRKEIEGEFWLGLAGVLSVLFGIFAALSPLISFLALTWLIAGYAIAFGVILILLAFRVRGASSTPTMTGGTPTPSQA